jgi:hypothetical protein
VNGADAKVAFAGLAALAPFNVVPLCCWGSATNQPCKKRARQVRHLPRSPSGPITSFTIRGATGTGGGWKKAAPLEPYTKCNCACRQHTLVSVGDTLGERFRHGPVAV